MRDIGHPPGCCFGSLALQTRIWLQSFTGSHEAPGEPHPFPSDSTVHLGSPWSTCPPILQAVSPQLVYQSKGPSDPSPERSPVPFPLPPGDAQATARSSNVNGISDRERWMMEGFMQSSGTPCSPQSFDAWQLAVRTAVSSLTDARCTRPITPHAGTARVA